MKTNAGGNRKQYGGAGGYQNNGLAQGGYGQNQIFGAGSAGIGYVPSNVGPSVSPTPLLPFPTNLAPTILTPTTAASNRASGVYVIPAPNKYYHDVAPRSTSAPR